MRYCVITRVNPLKCCGDDVIQLRGNTWWLLYGPRVPVLKNPHLRWIKRQAFTVGELLILDTNGAEIGFPNRKPGKWGCEERLDLTGKALMNFALYSSLRHAAHRVEAVREK